MAQTNLDAVFLQKRIENLRNDRSTSLYKFYPLRSIAVHSSSHMAAFTELEDQLLDLSTEISQLEIEVRGGKNRVANQVEVDMACDDDQIRGHLKVSLALTSKLDALGDDITRLKLGWEQDKSLDAITTPDAVDLQLATPTANHTPVAIERSRASPKPKNVLSPVSAGVVKIKKEEKPPRKKLIVKHWAPPGFHYVRLVRFLSIILRIPCTNHYCSITGGIKSEARRELQVRTLRETARLRTRSWKLTEQWKSTRHCRQAVGMEEKH
jgi:hypothetical protein